MYNLYILRIERYKKGHLCEAPSLSNFAIREYKVYDRGNCGGQIENPNSQILHYSSSGGETMFPVAEASLQEKPMILSLVLVLENLNLHLQVIPLANSHYEMRMRTNISWSFSVLSQFFHVH